MSEPQFRHYCEHCIHLGPCTWMDREYDLYYCEHEVKAVYARFGDNPIDYLSAPIGNGANVNALRPLWEARKQARMRKLTP